MNVVFPTKPGYAGTFLIGYRRSGGRVQRAGAAVLKRNYTIAPSETNPALGSVAPTDEAVPVFLQDQPGNLVVNGDFASGTGGWQAQAGATIDRVPDPAQEGNHLLRVNGPAGGRVIQRIPFPLGISGRRFNLTVFARRDATTTVKVMLRAGTTTICSGDSTQHPGEDAVTAAGRSPGVSTTELTVVLEKTVGTDAPIFYDDVAVHTVIYEHDLAIHKPEGDIVVLGFNDRSRDTQVLVDREPWLHLIADTAAGRPDHDLFEWEPRQDGLRHEAAGTFPDPPLGDRLPDDFQNGFFNGYLRDAGSKGPSLPTFLPAAARVMIARDSGTDYGFTLAGEKVTATVQSYSGSGPDEPSCWIGQTLPMNLDTLVIEPEEDRCYAVWRGAWDVDERPEDRYRRLIVKATD